jgi:hypothetical protein
MVRERDDGSRRREPAPLKQYFNVLNENFLSILPSKPRLFVRMRQFAG